MSDSFQICVKRNRKMAVLDYHSECYRHRVCNEAFSYELCSRTKTDINQKDDCAEENRNGEEIDYNAKSESFLCGE